MHLSLFVKHCPYFNTSIYLINALICFVDTLMRFILETINSEALTTVSDNLNEPCNQIIKYFKVVQCP